MNDKIAETFTLDEELQFRAMCLAQGVTILQQQARIKELERASANAHKVFEAEINALQKALAGGDDGN